MIRRSIDGKIQHQFDTTRVGNFHQPTKIFQRPQRRLDRVVTSCIASDGVWNARIVRSGVQNVIRSLSIGAPYRMNRREIKGVEAELVYIVESFDHIVERSALPM